MPALDNPRHEAFARALFAGLHAETRIERAQSTAYRIAYPSCAPGNSAEAAASRLLRRVKPICDRVNELVAELAKQKKVTIETITDEYNEARAKADRLDQTAVMLEASKAKAKLYGLVVDKAELTNKDNKDTPKDSNDIAIALLADVGIVEPDEDAKAKALEAYDAMIATLERIAAETLGKSSN